MAALSKANVSFIYIKKSAGGNALKEKVKSSRFFLYIKRASVYAAGIIVGHIGLVAWEWIIDIGIIRVLKSLCLPTGRNINFTLKEGEYICVEPTYYVCDDNGEVSPADVIVADYEYWSYA